MVSLRAVGRIRKRFLGFAFFYRGAETKVRVDPKRLKRAKGRLGKLTARNWGVSMEQRIETINRFTVGWTAYFAFADTPYPFEQLDEWLRRRMRHVLWKQWKRVRTKRRKLIALGIPEDEAHKAACSRKGSWRNSSSRLIHQALPKAYWADLGLARVQRSIPPLPGRDANRPVRTRTPGGVVGAGISPAPTRSLAATILHHKHGVREEERLRVDLVCEPLVCRLA
jgi:hypothetical protein